MQISDLVEARPWTFAPPVPVVGLDIGSRGSKAVLLTPDELHTAFIPTGLYMQETADELLARLLQQTGLRRRDLTFIVGTGYGRVSLKYEDIPLSGGDRDNLSRPRRAPPTSRHQDGHRHRRPGLQGHLPEPRRHRSPTSS